MGITRKKLLDDLTSRHIKQQRKRAKTQESEKTRKREDKEASELRSERKTKKISIFSVAFS